MVVLHANGINLKWTTVKSRYPKTILILLDVNNSLLSRKFDLKDSLLYDLGLVYSLHL